MGPTHDNVKSKTTISNSSKLWHETDLRIRSFRRVAVVSCLDKIIILWLCCNINRNILVVAALLSVYTVKSYKCILPRYKHYALLMYARTTFSYTNPEANGLHCYDIKIDRFMIDLMIIFMIRNDYFETEYTWIQIHVNVSPKYVASKRLICVVNEHGSRATTAYLMRFCYWCWQWIRFQ